MMSRTILVIEDQEDNLHIMDDMLTRKGYEVIEAVSGLDAVKIAETYRPDLILLKIQLPGIDGYEVTRRIRANMNISKTPIIVITACALSGEEVKAFEAGCDDYVVRPFNPSWLLAKIHKHLS